MRVLVADDDPTLSAAVCSALRHLGYQPTAAYDGLAAWREVEGGDISLVISDWEMPEINGIELCRRIRQARFPYYVYVMLLTSRGSHENMIEGLSAGADDYLAKPFDPNELRLRVKTAERILALEGELLEANDSLQRMNAKLRALSRVDPLMDIGNRLAFEERICEFHARAAQGGRSYGLVMCDVDHFKQVNDTYGHQTGDEVLRLAASAVRDAVRAGDYAFRYGGEEILLFLPNVELDGAVQAAERVRRYVGGKAFRLPGSEAVCRVTISCGVAAFPQNAREDAGWEAIVEAADQALYEDKRNGRNCVRATARQPVPQAG